MKTSDELEIGKIYTREELCTRFGIADATINNGVFKPKGHESIWLFITERKTPDRTQYADLLVGDELSWDGQKMGRTDRLIIEHEARGDELVAFYRKQKNEFGNYGFKCEGPFRYVSHTGSHPTHFKLTRLQPEGHLSEAVVEIVEIARARSRGQGFAVSSAARRAIELHAMGRATEFFTSEGFVVHDVSASRPYDLECRNLGECLYVEVKGTQGDGCEVLLTPNEVMFARDNKSRMALFVLHSVELEESEHKPVARGGTVRMVRPWDVDRGELFPLGYSYCMPDEEHRGSDLATG